jgi:hypothetical protein
MGEMREDERLRILTRPKSHRSQQMGFHQTPAGTQAILSLTSNLKVASMEDRKRA